MKCYLPGADAFEGGQVPNPDLAAMAGREEELVVGAEGQCGDGLGVAVEGGADGSGGGVDDVDGVGGGAGDEGGIRGHCEGAARVELLQGGNAAVVGLQSKGFHFWEGGETANPLSENWNQGIFVPV